MELKLYDTLTREKRPFRPLDPARVRMYVCGPTVYDFAHIGNARPVIVFDVLFRLLRHLYGADHVTYVRNITDVDDKIIARAAALGCLPPTVEPRATEHIEEMKTLIERLVAQGCAYVAEEHALFSVPSMPDYGKLSKRSLDELIAGARVEVAPFKRDPRDFVLWKPSKPGEPAWPSPCGIATSGRPGWHIECSAMAWKHLGETFDIHGGGIDLVFPHHENEIAQTRCAFHSPGMADFWMHNGFLQVEGRKMAKSEGNFVTIRALLADWPGEVLRLNMLRTHYRQPIDWTMAGVLESQKVLDHWYDIVADIPMPIGVDADDEVVGSLCDDLNTPGALTRLHALAGESRTCVSPLHKLELKNKLKASGAFLGVLAFTKGEALEHHPHRRVVDADKVSALIDARNAARKAKNFKEADRIRDELKAMGIELEDHKDGTTTWKVLR
jgi:cysteinyl-tRNA synthetase